MDKNDGVASVVRSDALLDVPPSDGYRATACLRWVRSAAHGGTILAQQYQSVYAGEEAVWCVVQHGLPGTPNASLERAERSDDTLQDLVRLCWRFARHQLNPDNIPLPTWARIGCEMLAKLRELDPAKYDETMKPNAPALPPQRSGDRQEQVVGLSKSKGNKQ